ncbi:sensor histidine kinase [Desulfoluna butyratoxydans]|uniref:histidine kinase n=1 Tax=Desulfoluna butyratoxydans TaxID=231438 RepID=A0A4U8YIS7_9BACT|nr:HAMP domain-containing sensor histidine kinase [Desulfoluna butyratoxydans]VFQ43596.1 histidine kinase- dna gyrase b- and hsp90-like atpase [Desulfoluna butyratoxydans]
MMRPQRPPREHKPRFFKTHAFRVFLSFVLFGSLLTLGYGLAVSHQMRQIHNKMENFRVQEEIKNYLDNYDEDKAPILTRSLFINIYDEIEDIPPNFRDLLRGLPDGTYFSSRPDGIGGPAFHRYLIRSLPGQEKKLYFIIDDGGFEARFGLHDQIDRVFRYGFFVAAALSIIVGLANAHLLIHPMARLLERVSRSRPEDLPVGFSEEYSHDEVGALARAMDSTNKRIRAFIEREQQFTRDASHELRTPVTVIKGAVELMEQLTEKDKKNIQRPLNRIQRSVSEMETLIESLLLKAREETAMGTASFSADTLVKDAMQESGYLVEGKGVILSFECTGNPSLDVSGPDFKMAVSNLIRNACTYTRVGTVTVRLEPLWFEVEDTGPGIDPTVIDQITDPFVKCEASQGHGIGLSIVKRVCDQAGWDLAISSRAHGTRVRITF